MSDDHLIARLVERTKRREGVDRREAADEVESNTGRAAWVRRGKEPKAKKAKKESKI